MEKLYWLDQIQSSDYSLVGNKALYLSQLFQEGYPVLPGFVIPGNVFWKFIEILGESELLLADLPHSSLHVNVDNSRQLQSVAKQIRSGITSTALPQNWSDTFLTAGEMQPSPAMILHPSLALPLKQLPMPRLKPENLGDNLEHVEIFDPQICFQQPAALTVALKQIWGQLFRARSLFYWQRLGIELNQINLAVLVQPIYNAISSGTIQANSDFWHLQATWGLECAIAKGQVFPDSYQIEAETGQVITSELGSKTIAYRLRTELGSSSLSDNSIEAAPTSEDQQKQYALTDKYLQQLIDLCQKLSKEVTANFSLTWTIFEIENETVSRQNQIDKFPDILSPNPQTINPKSQILYITEFIPQSGVKTSQKSKVKNKNISLSPTPNLVRGIAAAPGRVTGLAQNIIGDPQNIEEIPSDRILVAQSISPNWLPLLKKAAGIVTEGGGMTSHGAILARELGIPAIVNAVNVTKLIQTGDLLLLDGNRGEVQRLPVAREKSSPITNSQSPIINSQSPIINSQSPIINYPIATQLFVNLSQPQSLEKVGRLPVDGIGLLRSELMILDGLENLHPKEWLRQGRQAELVTRLTQLIMPFAAALMPRPVFYRALDLTSEDKSGLVGFGEGQDSPLPHSGLGLVGFGEGQDSTVPTPHSGVGLVGFGEGQDSLVPTPHFLNQRGTRGYLNDPASFDVELAALAAVCAAGYSNVKLILPFVRTVEEFVFCRRRVEQVGLMDNPNFQLWIMAEVPAVLFLLPDYVKAGVQGISIGTNDLTQLLLGVDRDSAEFGSILNGCHPAVMRFIQQLIETATNLGIPSSICGQAPVHYPEMIDSLVRWGITSISVDVNDVETTYRGIARSEQRLLLEAVRSQKSDV